jgi:hypothetical protein
MENYNKLLEKAREAYSKCMTGAEKRRLESIFPELVESLDEKIRKEILDYFKDLYEHGYPTKEWVAWIEKQDKKEIDKVELCFDHSPELKGQDRKMLESIIECIDGTGLLDSDQIDWLKSFKDKCSIKDDKALLEKQVEQADYNPYKATIESIAAMVERYADNGDLKDFYDNIKVKCKDAMEYGKTLSEKQGEQKETACDKCRKAQPSQSCQDITELGRCYLEHEKRGEQKLVWSEEDNGFVDLLLAIFTNMHPNELFTTNNITVFNGDNVSSGRIATWLKSFKDKCKDVVALLENQNKDGKVIFPKFTFDDVLALECCMKMTEKEEELHEQLQSLHDRVHDVYQPDKKGNSAQEEIKERDLFKFRDSVSKATKEGRDFFKFHNGDWIVHNDKKEVFFIKNISCGYLSLEDVDGITHYPCLPLDNNYHHWTIEDARNGDVLADDDSITIFRKIGNDVWNDVIDFYACYNFRSDEIIIQKDNLHCGTIKSKTIKIATKEQRDILFQKMMEAGYEWDAKNKELRKRSHPESNKVGPKFKVGDWVIGEGFNPILITDIKNNRYEFEFIDGTKRFSGIDCIDSDFNLWTIEDAKDGDVLAGHECYVLFKNIAGLNIRCHCTYHYMGYNPSFHVETLQNKTAFRPATNEQRDLLLQKIEDAGYEWDAKNKELRKQCNQESIVRAYPKFKVGDWIVHNDVSVYKIIEVCESWYEVISYNGETGKQYSIGFDNENNCRLWTIEDAKEGDVLAWDGSMCLALFKSIYNKENFCSYGLVGHCTQSFENREGFHDIEGAHPATKEQRNLFFQKMKEAGYEWNAKNKELRKQCNQEPVDKVGPKFQKGQWIFHEGFHPMFIVNIDGDKYEIEFTDNGTKETQPIDFIDKICHLWTIEDAKEGDVLAIGNTYFLFKGAIFKSFPTSPTVYISHCFAHATGAFRLTNGRDCGKFHAIEDGIEVCPATKEERDLLFHKMKEAGYEWDAKKKEMVKEINYK